MKLLFSPLGLALVALVVLWINVWNDNQPQIYTPQCGELSEKQETYLESHPCVNGAWIEYNCDLAAWEGWIWGEDGLNVEIIDEMKSIVYNRPQIAADKVHGFNRFDEHLEREMEMG